jgi:hypothetical protein
MMSDPRRHHYLPVCYLNEFGTNGDVWVFDRKDTRTRRQSTRDTGVVRDYYALIDRDGNRFNAVEKELFNHIDRTFKPCLAAFRERRQFAPESKLALSYFMAFLYARGPAFQSAFERNLCWASVKNMFPTVEATREVMLRNRYLGDPDDAAQVHEVFDRIHKEDYPLNVPPIPRATTLDMMITAARQLAPVFAGLAWFVAAAPRNVHFITSDQPFTHVPLEGATEEADPQARRILPLSHDLCLELGTEAGEIQYADISERGVMDANTKVASWAMRFIIGGDEAIVQHLGETVTFADDWHDPQVVIG